MQSEYTLVGEKRIIIIELNERQIRPILLIFQLFKIKSKFSDKSRFNSFPNNKFLDWSKLKEFADEEINVDKK